MLVPPYETSAIGLLSLARVTQFQGLMGTGVMWFGCLRKHAHKWPVNGGTSRHAARYLNLLDTTKFLHVCFLPIRQLQAGVPNSAKQ
jgi:hypothetical protein